MRILLDENIPVDLKSALIGHSVMSVNDKALGWKNITNGRLLAEMEGRFDLLLTADRNMFAQQNLAGRSYSVFVLPTNRRRDVIAMSDRIAAAIETIEIGEYLVLEKDGTLARKSFR